MAIANAGPDQGEGKQADEGADLVKRGNLLEPTGKPNQEVATLVIISLKLEILGDDLEAAH